MKIRSLHIENFRSLRDVTMENLGDLVVLIGANSSGKSNILDALTLFFSEFSAEPRRDVGSISDLVWFEQNTNATVKWVIELALSESESKVLTTVEQDGANVQYMGNSTDTIKLEVELKGPREQASLVIRTAEINGLTLVSDGELLSIDDHDGLSMEFLNRVSGVLKQKFTYIPAARNDPVSYQEFQSRRPQIRADVINDLRNLAQSGTAGDQIRWTHLRNGYNVFPRLWKISAL